MLRPQCLQYDSCCSYVSLLVASTTNSVAPVRRLVAACAQMEQQHPHDLLQHQCRHRKQTMVGVAPATVMCAITLQSYVDIAL